MVAPAAVGLAGAAVAVLLHVRDPHDSGTYGFCPFLALTGQPCPGCGGLRAANDLTRGDLVGALGSNALAVVLAGVLAVAWVLWVVRRWRGQRDRMIVLHGRAVVVVLTVMAVFTVVRMTPWGSWLAP
ncbi:DUF2752 domain-containing protein [Aeromicrobium chenweiae]|uniref:DUF2752 domain-containing protein n=1 Tax=Aeromicrobium chenweiae TaxID=2079793 RepID=A0A2S0WS15_9ACTN|nr:DUF2752 domain-containing protein [Aeromicrobium chenweiae]TGN33075.1 DUF2752 domain-containing protein [Aeromicrobium chenweiae]